MTIKPGSALRTTILLGWSLGTLVACSSENDSASDDGVTAGVGGGSLGGTGARSGGGGAATGGTGAATGGAAASPGTGGSTGGSGGSSTTGGAGGSPATGGTSGAGGSPGVGGTGGSVGTGGSSGSAGTGGSGGSAGTGGSSGTAGSGGTSGGPARVQLSQVQYWAYNIQDVNTSRQRNQLVGSHFDLYVLEPTITYEPFDIAGLIADIRQHNLDTRGVDPLVLAYVDIGEAEDWRWYWNSNWSIGNPSWIVAGDPQGWEGNYPVAYWDQTWKDIVIYGYAGTSHVDESLKAGFDGIYMDWVEAFSDTEVIAAARNQLGLSAGEARAAVADLMLDFIEEIRDYARNQSPYRNPNYLIVAQNASDLHGFNPSRYESLMDAIALEAIWYEGDGGFDNWGDSDGYNVRTNDLYPGWTEEVLAFLEPLKGKMPIFCAEYAQDIGGQNYATEVYTQLAPQHGFIPYCTRRSLAQLSTTPYPVGYQPQDY